MTIRTISIGPHLNILGYEADSADHPAVLKAIQVTQPVFIDHVPVDAQDAIRLNELGGLTPSAIAVADITNPTELGSYTGSGSSLALIYEIGGGVNKATLYVWDSAVASGANSPFVVAGLSGYWIAIGGTYNVAGPRRSITSVTGDYTVLADDDILLIDATSGNVTVTLPTSVGIKGKIYTTKRIDNSTNTVTIEGDGAETVDGNLNYTLYYLEFVGLVSDNTNWWSVE